MEKMQAELVRQQLLTAYVDAIFSGVGVPSGRVPTPAAAAVIGPNGTVAVSPAAVIPGSTGGTLGLATARLGNASRSTRGGSMLALQLTLANARSEQEYDLYFRSLEERFMAVDVLPEYKVDVTRRLLSGRQLMMWQEIVNKMTTGGKTPTYEAVRDEFITQSFPHSTLHEQMMRSLTTAAEKAQQMATEGPSTPTGEAGEGAGEGANEGATDGEKAGPQAARARGGQRSSGLASIRARAELLKDNMQRVSSRTGKPMPSEELWIQWATSLMRPSVFEVWQALEPKPTLLSELLSVMAEQIKDTPDADPTGVSATASLRPRRNRNNNSKKLVKRPGAGANTANTDAATTANEGTTGGPQATTTTTNEAPTTVVN